MTTSTPASGVPTPITSLPPIEPASRDQPLRLSFAQQRLWFLAQMGSAEKNAYNQPIGFKVLGEINLVAMRQALNALVARHEALRTTFVVFEGTPQLRIAAAANSFVEFEVQDISLVRDREYRLKELIEEEARNPFDLERGPIFRGRLIRLSEKEHCLLLTMHHLTTDGWSMPVLFRELSELYNSFKRSEKAKLPPLQIQYADFAQWQHRHMDKSYLRPSEDFWRKTLSGAPALLELPTDRQRPASQNYDGGFQSCHIDADLTAKLRALSRRAGVSMFVTMLTSWAMLIKRLSGQDDVVIGFASANRDREEVQGLVGFFVSNVPLRLDMSGHQIVSEALAQVKTNVSNARRHQDLPFDQIVEIIRPERSRAYNPIFQIGFNWFLSPNELPYMADLVLSPIKAVLDKFDLNRESAMNAQPTMSRSEYGAALYGETTPGFIAKFDLSPTFWDDGECIGGGLGFAKSLFDRSTIARWLDHWRCLLTEMVNNDTKRIDALTIQTIEQRNMMLHQWNQTTHDYPGNLCIHELFEAQVKHNPEVIAVVYGNIQLSYSMLNSQANQLAHYLCKLGVRPDDTVAICAERGMHLVVALLAVLKAGGAFVPVDPEYPLERVAHMLEDSSPRVLLTAGTGRRIAQTGNASCRVLDLVKDECLWASQPGCNIDRSVNGLESRHLAYLIYTSGSTGLPKAVAIEHRNTVNLIFWGRDAFTAAALSRTLFSTSISFDISIFECFVPLSTGATIFMVGDVLDLAAATDEISLVNTVPSPMSALLDLKIARWTAGVVNLCGEPLKRSLIDKIFSLTNTETIYNLYGPSETTTFSTWLKISRDMEGEPHIGRPIANTQIYILDALGELVPIGVTGEMYIGGAGVARGYLNRPELTAERFLRNPFSATPGARMYRTGDLARWRVDGNIEFLGRNDFQVKIRGFRIELGEIEARLLEHPEVTEAVVTAREDSAGDKRLVAYCVAAATIDASVLRAFLGSRVPDYMVPAAYVFLEALPLTPNGKLDRKALPAPATEAYFTRRFEAPLPGLETSVAAIWSALLGHERVGRQDSFFDLGGHSLLAVQMFSRIRQALALELPLSALFAAPVLAAFAEALSQAAASTLPAILRADRSGRLPLSFAQQRLWFLAQLGEVADVAYHQPMNMRFVGALDGTALQRALDRIVARHEALRTVFDVVAGEPEQRVLPEQGSHFLLVQHDLRGRPDAEQALQQLMQEEASAPFDLRHGPLIRGRLIRERDDQYVLLITQHHILSDGWSMGVLLDELSALYGAFVGGAPDPLPPLPVQYADFAVWQRSWVSGRVWQQQAAFWKQALAAAPELLDLPTDRARPLRQDYRGERISFSWGAPLTQGIAALGQRHGTTMFMTVLTSWAILLARLSGQEEIVTGTPTANRGRKEIEGLIGFFVNSLALRVDLSGAPTVAVALTRVKALALAALQHQDIPFEQVVDLVRPARSLAHNPLFQVMFGWQNAPRGLLAMPAVVVTPAPESPHQTSKFDLGVSLWQRDETIEGTLEFATALFDRSTIERFLGHWRCLLQAMVSNDSLPVQRLPLLSDAEQQLIVQQWNRTDTELPRHDALHVLFERQAAATADASAVVHDTLRLSYAELNACSNQLAVLLRQQGVAVGDRVLVVMERSCALIVALLATLKCGAAYVPIDPTFPDERQAFIASDSAASALLCRADAVLPAALGALARIDVEFGRLADLAAANTRLDCSGDSVAYVMYTSGSTGIPKGVLTPQRAIKRLLFNNGYHAFGSDDRVAFAANPAFDASTMELWGPLLNGGCVVIIDRATLLDPNRFASALTRDSINVLFLAVGLFNQYAEPLAVAFSRLRCLMVGGDVLDPKIMYRLARVNPPQCFLSVYGPTETTTYATSFPIVTGNEGTASIPIGRPIGNTRIYILDALGQPVPIGVRGEIYIGGEGVALGYLNQPELSAERFLRDPFVTDADARMYKSGDLGRWRADGVVEFLGRNDFQVKIRGFRIELGEIETRLAEHPGINDVIVLAREDQPGDKRLVAYATVASTAPTDAYEAVGAAQIEKWQLLYQDLYAQSDTSAEQPDFIGWNSSYTQAPIPEIEMLEWQANTVARILALKPRRVLEIGCGTGLLLLKIAAGCDAYVGTDFSAETVARLGAKLQPLGLDHVHLLQREGTDFSGIDAGAFDTVIINSVIQYFPNADYLSSVIEGALRALTPTGHLFVGDVRNLLLAEAFHGSVQLARAHRGDGAPAVRDIAQRAIATDKELLVSPAFFFALKPRLPDVGWVRVMPKLGHYPNELTKYRFDAIIGRSALATAGAVRVLDWPTTAPSLAAFAEHLQQEQPDALLVTSIGNRHVAADALMAQCLLHDALSADALVEDVSALIAQRAQTPGGWSPQDLHDACLRIGYTAELSWAASDRCGAFHAWLQRHAPDDCESPLRPASARYEFPYASLTGTDDARTIAVLTNEPTRASLQSALAESLRASLQGRLPEYMIPAHYVFLDALPLTTNGKVDRKALPAPEASRSEVDYVAPRHRTEEILARIWAEALSSIGSASTTISLRSVGIHCLRCR